ncbi:hypothetical protein [Amycolatopsis sp. NPDC051128]|uniref:hypothetical protein n=1 Tax=Amycolatopsis sp. NPDC051128 TaxID=3155412 RepID=UPI0034314C6E
MFLLVECVLTDDDGVVSEREPGAVVSLVWALDEVFIGFSGRSVAVVRRELEDACEVSDCLLAEDALDVFAAEIAAGQRVEIDGGTIRGWPDGADWDDAPF